MVEKNTIGSFMLKALAVVIGFNFIYSLMVLFIGYFKEYINELFSEFGYGWVFSPVVDFLSNGILAWLFLLFTDTMAFAVILFISLIWEAFNTRWK